MVELILTRASSRLLVRAAVPMTILVVVVAGLFAVMQVRATERRRVESLEAYADLLGQLVLSNLRDGMLTKDRGRLQGLLARLSAIEPIVQVRVVNKAGAVIYADDASALGEVLGRDDPSCVSCHRDAQPPSQRSATVRLRPADGGEVFRAIQPIYIEADCVQCHDEPQGSVIGIVMTDIDRELLTGALGRQTTESIWAFVGAGVLILVALGLLVRRLVVSRLRNLSRVLDLLRGGARTMSLTTASGDEIDELTRAAHGLVLDLDERFAVERALHRVAPVLARHAGPALILDDAGVVVAANRLARERLAGDAKGLLVGRQRSTLQGDLGGLLGVAREQGWALSDDAGGPGVFTLARADGEPIGFLELWAPEPDVEPEEQASEASEVAEDGGVGAVAPPEAADWRLYAAVVLQEISARTLPWRGVLRLDPRLSLARRMLADLAQVADEVIAEGEEVDLKSVALLVRSDVQRDVPSVRWHTALDPPVRVVGARYQLRALLTRITAAAAAQAGEGGHVVQFCYRARRSSTVFVGAWASRPGREDDTALVDPAGQPALAHVIASAHGGGFEVDPVYDLSGLAELRGLRVPCEGPGTLYVAELVRGVAD